MQTVVSRDGTRLAYWRGGVGPPLLLVHGASHDHASAWALVAPELERRFTVYALDRRGRGGSGDFRGTGCLDHPTGTAIGSSGMLEQDRTVP